MINNSAKFKFRKSLMTLALPATLTMVGCASTGVETTAINEGEPQISATVETSKLAFSFPPDRLDTPNSRIETELTTESEKKTSIALSDETEMAVINIIESTEEAKTNETTVEETAPERTDFASVTTDDEVNKEQLMDNVELNVNVAENEVEAIAYPQHHLVKFKFNSAEISASDMDNLTEHASYLSKSPKAVLVVSGHADSQGDSLYNQILSEQRAQQVADLLIQMGTRPEQIKTQAFGDDQPVGTLTAYKENRRVELTYEEPTLLSSRAKSAAK